MIQLEMTNLPDRLYEREGQLLRRLLDGDQAAREELVFGRIPYVRVLARRYATGQARHHLEDLYSEATAELVKIAWRFDPAGCRCPASAFGLSVSYGVRTVLREYMARNVRFVVGISGTTRERIFKTVGVRKRLRQTLGREPRLEEIADLLPYKIESVCRYLLKADEGRLEMDEWDQLVEQLALQDPRTGELEALRNERVWAAERITGKVVRLLKPRDRGIIIRHFGLDGQEPLNSVKQASGKNQTQARTIRKRRKDSLDLARRLLRVSMCSGPGLDAKYGGDKRECTNE